MSRTWFGQNLHLAFRGIRTQYRPTALVIRPEWYLTCNCLFFVSNTFNLKHVGTSNFWNQQNASNEKFLSIFTAHLKTIKKMDYQNCLSSLRLRLFTVIQSIYCTMKNPALWLSSFLRTERICDSANAILCFCSSYL